MVHDNFNLFESAIQITKERDKKSLETALINTLAQFIDFDTLILLRLPSVNTHTYLEVAGCIPENCTNTPLKRMPHKYGDPRVYFDTSLTQCVEGNKVIHAKNQTTSRTLFPITLSKGVSGVFDIYGHTMSEYSEKLITGFISIYSNFQSIITDNEHDTLTGLLNRKTFDVKISELLLLDSHRETHNHPEMPDRRNHNQNLCHWVALLDIDHFKSINDNFGHVYGDEVLLVFAKLMQSTFRSSDLLFRYGGEEFVVVISTSDDADIHQIFDDFRKKLETSDFGQVGKVTVSIGTVKINKNEHTTTVLEYADKALYFSKDNGRNQVNDYHSLIKAGKLTTKTIKDDIELF